MDGHLTSHHLEIMRRSLACGGLPNDQVAWILAEAARLLAERDEARSVLTELVRPMADVRRLLNELHALFVADPTGTAPGATTQRTPPARGPAIAANYQRVHKKLPGRRPAGG